MRLERKFLVYGEARCKTSSCDYRHPPVCRNYKSGNSCIIGNTCRRNPARGRKVRVLKEQLRDSERKKGLRLCISKFSAKRSLLCGKLGKRD